jgi:hypothetical protein
MTLARIIGEKAGVLRICACIKESCDVWYIIAKT